MYKLAQLASIYGFDLLDYSEHPDYQGRKGKVLALKDRRNGRIVCVYSTGKQIRDFLLKSR